MLELDPNAIAPVTTTFVLAPSESGVLVGQPISNDRDELQAKILALIVPFSDMPAIALAIANDVGRRGGGVQCQHAASLQNGGARDFHKTLF